MAQKPSERPSDITDRSVVWIMNPSAEMDEEEEVEDVEEENFENFEEEKFEDVEEEKFEDVEGEKFEDVEEENFDYVEEEKFVDIEEEKYEMEDDEEDKDCDSGTSGAEGEENTSSTKEEMEKTRCIKTGKWLLFLNRHNRNRKGDTALDRGWEKVKQLVQQGRLWKACCSTSFCRKKTESAEQSGDIQTTSKRDRGVISCFTRDYTDKDDVWDAAGKIRKVVAYPPPMYYKTSKATKDRKYRETGAEKICLFKHYPDGNLYVSVNRNGIPKWERVTRKTVVKLEVDDYSPSDITDMKWAINLKGKRKMFIKRAWVLRIEKQSTESEEGQNLCTIWGNVEELVRQWKLKNAAMDKGDIQDFQFIYCFVEDAGDEEEAASDIRSVVYIQQPIFYKEEINRLQGPDAWKNFIRTADKMHTQDGRLMGQKPAWTQLVPNEVEPPVDQPSIVESSMIITAKRYILPLENKPGRWTLFMDRLVVDKEGNTELDRAWVVIKELVQKGVLVDAVTTTAATNPFNLQHNQGAIFCYTRDYSDLNDVKMTADAIRKAVHPSMDMLFEPVTTVLQKDLQNWDYDQVATYKQDVSVKFAKLYAKVNGEWVFAPHK